MLSNFEKEEILIKINESIKELLFDRKVSITMRKNDKAHFEYWKWSKYYFVYLKCLNKSMRDMGTYELTEKEEHYIQNAMVFLDSILNEYQKNNPVKYQEDVSGFSGVEYEVYCMDLLKRYGWEAMLTKGGGDFGADIIAKKDNIKAVIQCKRQKSRIGISAVKDIFVANAYYKGTIPIVCSNMDYSKPSRDLAQAIDVQLIHHSQLNEIEKLI